MSDKDRKKGFDDGFYCGAVAALDIVASRGEGTIFRHIAETYDTKRLHKEVMANGLKPTKEMWEKEMMGCETCTLASPTVDAPPFPDKADPKLYRCKPLRQMGGGE